MTLSYGPAAGTQSVHASMLAFPLCFWFKERTATQFSLVEQAFEEIFKYLFRDYGEII